MKGDYTQFSQEDLTRENLINNTNFINDASQFLADREDYFSLDREDIYDRYLEHFRYQNVNEVTAVRDMYQAQDYINKGDEEGLTRMGNLMSTFDKQDSEFTSETITDYLGGVFTAPSTYAGMFSFGAAKGGSLAAQQGIKFGIKELIRNGVKKEGMKDAITTTAMKKAGEYSRTKALREGFAKGGYKTLIGAGVVDGAAGAGTTAAQEQTRVDLGLKDEIDMSTVALSGALSMTPGALLGAYTGTRKAITANVAENYAIRQLQTKRNDVEEVFKNITSKNIGNKTFVGKASKELNDRLKLSLEETAGTTAMQMGKKLKLLGQEEPIGDLAISLDDKIIANIASAGAELADKVGPRFGVVKGSKEDLEERITSRVYRALTSEGDVGQDKLIEDLGGILEKYKITPSEFGALYLADISQAGRTLGRAGRIQKDLNKRIMGELNEVDKALFTLGEGTEAARKKLLEKTDKGKFLNATSDFLTTLNKARIGMMTIQAATTVRNTSNGYLRNYIYALNNFGSAVYRGMQGVMYYPLKGAIFNDDQAREAGKLAVALGKAELRTSYDSAVLKDMVLGLQSEDTAVLIRMFKDPVLGNSDRAKQLFRELGDIGQLAGNDQSRLMKTARFFNTFNTMSDNLFKSAVFSREIDKMIRADIFVDPKTGKTSSRGFKKNEINNLSDLVNKGGLKLMDDKSIAEAMNQAMDFTYQTGRFRGRGGGFNDAAALFIDFFSKSAIASTFVPFPRYMVNAFRFAYEHAPVLGAFNLGNILNKSGAAERFGKQVTGFSLLAAFYGMREHFGDENTGAYVYKNPFGHGTFDARAALGPFTPFAVIADMLYSFGGPNGPLERYGGSFFRLHENDKVVPDFKARDLITSLTGGAFGRAGVSLDFVDGLTKAIVAEGDIKAVERAEEIGARLLGHYLSTFVVGAGMLKDVYAMISPEYRLLSDNTDVEFLPYALKQATRSFPIEINADGDGFFERPAQTSPYKTTGIRNHMPLFRQISGLTPQEEKNDVQKEFDRFKMDYVQVAPRKLVGDPKGNREARQFVATMVESGLSQLINSPEYINEPSDLIKKKMLTTRLNAARNEALAYATGAKEWDTDNDIIRKNKSRFFKNLSSAERAIVVQDFENIYNVEVERDDYGELLNIARERGFIK